MPKLKQDFATKWAGAFKVKNPIPADRIRNKFSVFDRLEDQVDTKLAKKLSKLSKTDSLTLSEVMKEFKLKS